MRGTQRQLLCGLKPVALEEMLGKDLGHALDVVRDGGPAVNHVVEDVGKLVFHGKGQVRDVVDTVRGRISRVKHCLDGDVACWAQEDNERVDCIRAEAEENFRLCIEENNPALHARIANCRNACSV